MTQATLNDGTKVFCLRKPEAKMLDHHVDGYLQNGIKINDGDVVFDVGANVGVFGIRACLLYTSPSPRDATLSRMPSSA